MTVLGNNYIYITCCRLVDMKITLDQRHVVLFVWTLLGNQSIEGSPGNCLYSRTKRDSSIFVLFVNALVLVKNDAEVFCKCLVSSSCLRARIIRTENNKNVRGTRHGIVDFNIQRSAGACGPYPSVLVLKI